MLKPLPVGIQTFSDIIEGGYLYVDKTPLIYELIRYPKGTYFLSRPRRFGKSVLVSTLNEIFSGNKELFKGLDLYDSDYRWHEHPVIRIDFSLRVVSNAEQFEKTLDYFLQEIADANSLTLRGFDYQTRFANLIAQLGKRDRVVILIDEYDKPLIDNVTDVDTAVQIRNVLKGFYGVIKGMDEHIRFVFLTGISRFSRAGVFSGLNNLRDISLDDQFATLTGITQSELEENFDEHIQTYSAEEQLSAQTLLEQIRHWYNGFQFSGRGEAVYNPYSLLLFFSARRFSNFWFESGTPTFLIRLIQSRNYDVEEISGRRIDETSLSTYDIDNLQLIPLLLQTGYLTIKSYSRETRLYTLGYPNFEVEDAFLGHLLSDITSVETAITPDYIWQIINALKANELDKFFTVLKVFFAQIDYTIQVRQEKYYQTIFYLIFKLIGLRTQAEVTTDRGRIDAVIELDDAIYLFEFKLDGNAQAALDQIIQKEYFVGYLDKGKTLYLVGVNFDVESHSVSEWKVETLPSDSPKGG